MTKKNQQKKEEVRKKKKEMQPTPDAIESLQTLKQQEKERKKFNPATAQEFINER